MTEEYGGQKTKYKNESNLLFHFISFYFIFFFSVPNFLCLFLLKPKSKPLYVYALALYIKWAFSLEVDAGVYDCSLPLYPRGALSFVSPCWRISESHGGVLERVWILIGRQLNVGVDGGGVCAGWGGAGGGDVRIESDVRVITLSLGRDKRER